ncbi:MOSC domain-containing protein [Zhongshania guokunii]|uniref:MOSC domain-containing protein n=1 Tax=Zhongshania guokunii TaxID=641783 RepID=A0ABV3U5W2_9GAMM
MNSRRGRLEWIGLRPERKAPMVVVEQVLALADWGLKGDRRMVGSKGSGRQVTIISSEFIQSIADNLGRDTVSVALLRRNIVVSGLNLNALRHQYFQIGEAVFQATALCPPCWQMEAALGAGGMVAMCGFGGLCAKIVESGNIRCGDPVVHIPPGEYRERQLSLY